MLECDVFIEKVCYSEVSIKYAIGKTTEWSGLNVIIYIINIWKAVFFIILPCFNSKSKSFKMKKSCLALHVMKWRFKVPIHNCHIEVSISK